MQIILNGQQKEFINQENLNGVICQLCKDSHPVIAEVNGHIIKNTLWDKTLLKDGDTVELINFVGGG